MMRATTSADREVAARVRQARITSGMTLPDLADVLGISHQQIYKYETGMNRLTVGRLCAIADALEMPASDLLPNGSATRPVARMRRSTGEFLLLLHRMSPEHAQALLTLARALAAEVRP